MFTSLPCGPARDWLEADARALCGAFLTLVGGEIKVLLRSLAHDACRRFHRDNPPIRLVVTYAGPGTEIPVNAAAAREALDTKRGAPLELFNESVLEAGQGLQEVGPGDVVLLKGERWREEPGAGAVHRSPSIEEAGLRRLVLRMDGLQLRGTRCPSPQAPLRALPAD